MGESFADRWGRKARDCGFGAVAPKLVACGPDLLPAEAAPCLTFDRADRPAPLWEVFGVPFWWPAAERERLAPFRMIGSDGAGNPVCFEQATGAVVLLDHEDHFRTRQFVNTGVRQLAECLLAFMGERDAERFRSAVRDADPAAMADGSFWWHEAAGLGT